MPIKKTNLSKTINNNNLLTPFVDDVQIYSRKDGMWFIRYTAFLPEGKSEQARLMTDDKLLHEILDTMCSEANYYPQKPKKNKKKEVQGKTVKPITSDVIS